MLNIQSSDNKTTVTDLNAHLLTNKDKTMNRNQRCSSLSPHRLIKPDVGIEPSTNNFTPLTFKPSLPTYIDTFHLSSVSFTLLIVAVLSFLVKTPLYSSYSFISRRRTPLQFFLLHATQFRLFYNLGCLCPQASSLFQSGVNGTV